MEYAFRGSSVPTLMKNGAGAEAMRSAAFEGAILSARTKIRAKRPPANSHVGGGRKMLLTHICHKIQRHAVRDADDRVATHQNILNQGTKGALFFGAVAAG